MQANYDGPHVSPKGKAFWVSKSSPSNVKYTEGNPNIKQPAGTEKPSQVSAGMVPVAPAAKPPQNNAPAAPKPQSGASPETLKRIGQRISQHLGQNATAKLDNLIAQLQQSGDQRKLKAAMALKSHLAENTPVKIQLPG